MLERYENPNSPEAEESQIQDPLGLIPDAMVQQELDANPELLASILEHQQNISIDEIR